MTRNGTDRVSGPPFMGCIDGRIEPNESSSLPSAFMQRSFSRGAERGRAAATPLAERVRRFIKWAQRSQGW